VSDPLYIEISAPASSKRPDDWRYLRFGTPAVRASLQSDEPPNLEITRSKRAFTADLERMVATRYAFIIDKGFFEHPDLLEVAALANHELRS
jgi:hypothetical protein